MKIIHQILDLYRDSVKSGLDVRLNLWTRDGEEFFSFSRCPKTQDKPASRRRWRRRGSRITPEYASSPPGDVRATLEGVRAPLKGVRPPLKDVRPPLKDVRSPLECVRPPPWRV